MDLAQMLSELRSQKDHIEEAILVLQRLASSGAKRRGRPPKWMSSAELPGAATMAIPQRGRKPFSAATRKKMAAAQRKRWAAAKKAEAA